MKTFIKVLAVLGLAAVLGIVAVVYFTSGMSDAADGFFRAIAAKDTAAAQARLSEGFRRETDAAALERFLAESGLDTYESSSWTNRKVSGGTGELEGTVTNATGGTVPLRIVFVKEAEAWKIHGITRVSAGTLTAEEDDIAEDAGTDPLAERGAELPPFPSPEEQVAMVDRAFEDFVTSLDEKSMAHFRGTTSQLWQEQFPLERFESSYAAIYDFPADYDQIRPLVPAVEPVSTVKATGELELVGVYPTNPSRLTITASYIPENGEWKLSGFHFQAQEPE